MSKKNNPVLLFGGTFNPPHYGHVNLIQYVLEHMSFSRVYIVPSYQPPHKSDFDTVSFEQRLAMTRIMFSNRNLPGYVEISDMEKSLAVPSYSWRTLEHLKKIHPDSKIYMLIGMDMYINLQNWGNYEDLVKNYNFIVLKREHLTAPLNAPGDIFLDNPYWNTSSHRIRKLLSEYLKTLDKNLKMEIEISISPELFKYIVDQKIYR